MQMILVYFSLSQFSAVYSRFEAEEAARELSLKLFHTSVKTDKNVLGVFHWFATVYLFT